MPMDKMTSCRSVVHQGNNMRLKDIKYMNRNRSTDHPVVIFNSQ